MITTKRRQCQSFISKGDHGVDTHGAARRNVAGEQRDEHEQCRETRDIRGEFA